MLLTRPKSPTPPRRGGGGPLSSRGGTLLVAALLSLLAGAALLVFLRQYREDVGSSDRARVVVATSLVPKGTSGDVILEQRLYRVAQVREDDVRDGALTDPADLKGQAVTSDIFPGHQLKLEDLEEGSGKLPGRLADYDRAMTVPVDRSHGMIGQLGEGDRVDVITTTDSQTGGITVATIVVRDALVMAVPESDGSNNARQQPVTIRVPDPVQATIAAGADDGKVWLVLRPPLGARSHTKPGRAVRATPAGPVEGQPLDAFISARVGGR
jgi:Flp pilus assembly protein CpaB